MTKKIGIKEIVSKGYCIGCGVCSIVESSSYSIEMDHEGKYQATIKEGAVKDSISSLSVCPFSNESLNENDIGERLFGKTAGIHHDNNLGYYLKNFAGSVSEDTYREKGSSGGFGSWLAALLLEEHLVDYVIHIRPVKESSILYAYSISSTREEVREGAKSKYYPIELSKVLDVVRNTPGKYLLIGIPCFIKAVRLLSEQEPIFKERIAFTIGLVCGHLKTDRFAKAIGWELGIQPDELETIDFRVKLPSATASSYGAAVKGKGKKDKIISPMKNILVRNWGHGLFRYNACDYCDDVLAETADVTVGDAWLSKYVKDGRGTNVLVVRNPIILSLLEKRSNDLSIEEIVAEKVYKSQAGGFRHRREGLSYRLYIKDQKQEWRPKKRVDPSNCIPERRKKIYEQRINLLQIANDAYEKAFAMNDFSVFMSRLKPSINTYNKLYRRPIGTRVAAKILRTIKSIFRQ